MQGLRWQDSICIHWHIHTSQFIMTNKLTVIMWIDKFAKQETQLMDSTLSTSKLPIQGKLHYINQELCLSPDVSNFLLNYLEYQNFIFKQDCCV